MKQRIREQTCHLLPQRAIFWEEQQILILSDIHIGKATTFRKAGLFIPDGNMEDDLLKISKLLNEFKPKKCIIVGDLIHAKSGLSQEVKQLFSDWIHNANTEIHLIMGNHDVSLAKNLPEEWPLHLHIESLLIEPFYFSHFPILHEKWFVWSGHLHPKIELKSKNDRVVLRCFQIFPHLGILPAFSSFVGGTYIKKEKNCAVFGIADSFIIEL
jgi:DNA ligase-associated metallophosphoesterase